MISINFNYKVSFYNKSINTQYFVMNWEQITEFWKFKKQYDINLIRDYEQTRNEYFYYKIDEKPIRLDNEFNKSLWIVKSKLDWKIKTDDLVLTQKKAFTMENGSLYITCSIDDIQNYKSVDYLELRNDLK